MIKRNSIIVLGNGFDIAHNLPTKYSDFADNYLEIIYNHLIIYNQISYKEDAMISSSFLKFIKYFYIHGISDSSYSNYRGLEKLMLFIQNKDKKGTLNYLKENFSLISSIISNNFLAKLYNNSYTNWFDIENAFFEELVRIKEDIIKYLEGIRNQPNLRTSGALKEFIDAKKKEITKLNNELTEIKEALKEYLNSIDIKATRKIEQFFTNNFITSPRRLHFINFNYTNTIDFYLPVLKALGHDAHILNIHGSLNENIIFGYGNDHNDDYQIMKDLEIDEFLENFKTFEYLNNNRYSKFFKEDIFRLGTYNVYVIGHSLQQTDKTLLNGIFNSKNCMEVHFLKRGDLDEKEAHKAYRKLLFALSRIVTTENDELRLKVKDYENIVPFPS